MLHLLPPLPPSLKIERELQRGGEESARWPSEKVGTRLVGRRKREEKTVAREREKEEEERKGFPRRKLVDYREGGGRRIACADRISLDSLEEEDSTSRKNFSYPPLAEDRV